MSLIKALATTANQTNEAESLTATEAGTKRSLDTVINEGLLAGVTYNYMSMALSGADTIETFTYKTGGSGGTVVATIVITYTTSDRDVLSSVSRTV